MSDDMNEKKFEKLLRLRGADFSRWPDNDATAARRLLESSAGAREQYKQAAAVERALNSFQAPDVPAGLAVRAANEALLRARGAQPMRQQKPPRRWKGLIVPWYVGMAPAGVAVFAMLAIFVLPTLRGPGDDVSRFMAGMDTFASRSDQELKDADDVLGMLQVADSGGQTPADQNGGVTSEDLMNTLFGDDSGNGAKL
jgi:hypothetical protein